MPVHRWPVSELDLVEHWFSMRFSCLSIHSDCALVVPKAAAQPLSKVLASMDPVLIEPWLALELLRLSASSDDTGQAWLLVTVWCRNLWSSMSYYLSMLLNFP